MKIQLMKTSPEKYAADMIVIGLYERERDRSKKKPARNTAVLKHTDGGVALDRALNGGIGKQIKQENFSGGRGETICLFTAGRIPARFVLLVGLGPKKEWNQEKLREAGATIARQAEEVHAKEVALVLERSELEQMTAPERARAIAEGMQLGTYRFDRYKTTDAGKPPPVKKLTFLYAGNGKPIHDATRVGAIVAKATCFARDLGNQAGSDNTPQALARTARRMVKRGKLRCTVWNRTAIAKARMGGVLAVAKGSSEPPAFIRLDYKPTGKSTGHIVLIGKGVTFDAGGISLKPPRSLPHMKDDMGGAATVLGAMQAITELKPRTRVTALIPAAENMPDGGAFKPDDIITMRSGKTVEIISTDAEGRLLLADALSLAGELKPDAIIDVATLTGGAVYCCGELYTLVVGTNQRLVDRLLRASSITGERVWQLPLVEEYRKGFTTGIADLRNTGKSKAQTINGAIFLKEFVDEKIPWVHLDIAASSLAEEELPLSPQGPTGAMVRTLVQLVMDYRKRITD